MTQPTSLHFVHRFRSGRLGTLVIEHVVYDEERHGPGPLTYTWNGPRPPYGGERLKWTIECQRIFADRFKVIFTYVTADERGKTVIFQFAPGQRPQKIPATLAPADNVNAAIHFNTRGEPYSGEGGSP